MPRGRKKAENITVEEQLALVEKKIEALGDDLKALRLQKKDLQVKIEEKRKDEVYRAVVSSGKSLEEVLEILKNNSEANAE